MNIMVIGLGSMGKRRMRLLKEHEDVELCGIDSQASRCEEAEEKFGVSCFNSIDAACRNREFDAAVVCTSPLSHSSIIKECLERNLHVFTEINLVPDGYAENSKLAQQRGRVLFLSSTFLYRKETRAIIEKVHQAVRPLNYIYHVGQYLPDWHPWESYNSYFIGNSKTNGCREIMAIDLPWILTAFGAIRDVKVMKGRNTGLDISYDDSYLLMLEHETGAKGVFAVDVVSRKPYRHIDVYGEDLQLSWNGTADSLYEYDIKEKKDVNIVFSDASEHIEGYAAFVTENPYREELNAFLENIHDSGFQPAWDFGKDRAVLDIIDRIEG